MSEETLFHDGDVLVTTSRVRVGGTTYALRNITSVRIAKTYAADHRVAVGIVLFIALWMLMNIWMQLAATFFFRDFITENEHVRMYIVWPCAAWALVTAWFVAVKVMRPPPPIFHCSLATSGEEVQALSSTNEVFIEGVVNAISEAIVRMSA